MRQQLTKDLAFLASINTNDYSLLMSMAATGALNRMSIIDVLSPWSWNRRLGWVLVPGIWMIYPRFTRPRVYARRLLRTFDEIVLVNSN
jgi:hypothetical protein